MGGKIVDDVGLEFFFHMYIVHGSNSVFQFVIIGAISIVRITFRTVPRIFSGFCFGGDVDFPASIQ